MHVRRYDDADRTAVIALWDAAGLLHPGNDPHGDIDRKVADSPWGFIVMDEADSVIGTAMVGYDGHRGWINYLGCHPDHRRRGVATTLMAEARRLLIERGCAKVNLQVRAGNDSAIRFYESLGYTDDQVSSLGLRLVVDT
jgi:ribosomal protein S18 acetylase RimI-like enzyme